MDSLAPPLELLLAVRYEIEKGNSVRSAIKTYLSQSLRPPSRSLQFFSTGLDDLPVQVSQLLASYESGTEEVQAPEGKRIHRFAILNVLGRGLRGEPIHTLLLQLEEEVIEACEEDLEMHIATLPVKMLFPLLMLQFPAFLLLLLGPLFLQIIETL